MLNSFPVLEVTQRRSRCSFHPARASDNCESVAGKVSMVWIESAKVSCMDRCWVHAWSIFLKWDTAFQSFLLHEICLSTVLTVTYTWSWDMACGVDMVAKPLGRGNTCALETAVDSPIYILLRVVWIKPKTTFYHMASIAPGWRSKNPLIFFAVAWENLISWI